MKVDFKSDFQSRSWRASSRIRGYSEGLARKEAARDERSVLQNVRRRIAETLRERWRTDLLKSRERQEKSRLKDDVAKHLLASVALMCGIRITGGNPHTIYDIVRYNTAMGLPREKDRGSEIRKFRGRLAQRHEKTKLRTFCTGSRRRKASRRRRMSHQGTHPAGPSVSHGGQGLGKKLKEDGGMDRLEEDIRLRKTSDILLEQAAVTV